MKSSLILCLVVYTSLICMQVEAQPASAAIFQIKEKRKAQKPGDFSLLDHPYRVEGYFFKDPLPLLMTSPEWEYVNTIMPDSVFIVLDPKYFAEPARYHGAYLRLTGVVNTKEDSVRGQEFIRGKLRKYNVDFILTAPPEILIPGKGNNSPDIKHFSGQPERSHPFDQKDNKNIAFLYAGGYDGSHARLRYWNDIKFMYHTLQNRLGYSKDHIIVVYKDGKGEDDEIPVDHAASREGLGQAFTDLDRLLNGNDLFFFMTNHGGGYDEEDKRRRDGLADVPPTDEIDKYKIDEVSYYYEDYPLQIRDDYFSEQINRLHMGRLVALFEQCYGGGFIYDLRGKDRVLMSACTEFSSSYGDDSAFDVFSYHFTAALNGATHNGDKVDADEDKNGKISMLEAFNYAIKMDNQKETPQLEDTGEGKPVPKPVALKGRDGWQASMTYLGP